MGSNREKSNIAIALVYKIFLLLTENCFEYSQENGSFFVSVLCFFFDGSSNHRDSDSCRSFSLLKAIAIRFLTTIAIAIVGRAITIWEAIQKRIPEPSTKRIQKFKQKD